MTQSAAAGPVTIVRVTGPTFTAELCACSGKVITAETILRPLIGKGLGDALLILRRLGYDIRLSKGGDVNDGREV